MKKLPESSKPLDKVQKNLLILLRRALSKSQERPCRMAESDWIALGNLAVNCGVQAVAYDGLLGLPEELLPPRDIKIHWAVNTAAIEDRNRKHKDVLIYLSSLMRTKKMRMLLLNGLGNASFYPVPEHRECSDIDIYTFDESYMVDKMISNKGITVDAAPNFSSDFVLNGVLVENHHHFFNIRTSPLNRRFENRMQSLLLSEKVRRKVYDTVYIPTPNENILLMSLRLLNKFAMGSATLRHLCDWSTFLTNNAMDIDFTGFYAFLKENGVYEVLSEMTEICIANLGLNEIFRMPYAPRNAEVENEMLQRMLNVKKRIRKTFSNSEKKEWLRSISWNYHMVHRDHTFWIVVLKTLFFS